MQFNSIYTIYYDFFFQTSEPLLKYLDDNLMVLSKSLMKSVFDRYVLMNVY